MMSDRYLRPEIEDVFKKFKVQLFKLTQTDDFNYTLELDKNYPGLLTELKQVMGGFTTINTHFISANTDKVKPDTQAQGTAALKYDKGKPRMGLIDSGFLHGLATVLTFGARKYAPHNWRKGFHLSRPYDALQRHLTDWNNGQNLDNESGLPLLDHAACELMFLRNLWENRVDLDDRFVSPEHQVLSSKQLADLGFTSDGALKPGGPIVPSTPENDPAHKKALYDKLEELAKPTATSLQGTWEVMEIDGGDTRMVFIPEGDWQKMVQNLIPPSTRGIVTVKV